MSATVLITGGAGFIGSHVANELLQQGYKVRALDSLAPQIHGPEQERPAYLSDDVELVVGDIRNEDLVARVLKGVDAVYHFAALVGVGQSMYQIEEYVSVNTLGTAVLLEKVMKSQIRKLVVASSMSIYGEGLYQTPDGKPCHFVSRSIDQLRRHEWEVVGPNSEELIPVATPESKAPNLASVYALSKYDQEQMCLIAGRAYGVPTIALRFFNAYGPNQALSNPYTGVLAIFAARLLNDRKPIIFEDGNQLRDLVSVYDIARACRLALESDAKDVVVNVGSGIRISIRETAEQVAKVLDKRIGPEITESFRVGDIRHCYPDISLAKKLLGYSPRVTLEAGLADLASWLDRQTAHDRFMEMKADLMVRGLVS